jgi:hypothetical protein
MKVSKNIPEDESVVPPVSENPDAKPVRRVAYMGVWMVGKAGNDPILTYHPDFAEEIEVLLAPLKGQIIRASIQMEEKPLITRLNLRGLRDVAVSLLDKALKIKD